MQRRFAIPMTVSALVGGLIAWQPGPWWQHLTVVLVAALVALTDHRSVRQQLPLRVLGSAGIVALGFAGMWTRWDRPTFGLFTMIGAITALTWLWSGFRPLTRQEGQETTNLAATGPACGLGALILLTAHHTAAPVGWACLALAALAVAAAVADGKRHLAGWPDVLDALLATPATLMVVSFGLLAFVGSILLLLPGATSSPISGLDALFTATSAVCVTGLAVLDTPGTFTGFGQLCLLLLIQVGGLGIMTFATAAAVYLGRRLGVREERVAAELLGSSQSRQDLRGALSIVLKVTFFTEALGAALLWPAFMRHGDGPLTALWRAVFTSVSAFCNAGFALQSDSLVPYQSDAFVLGVLSLVIVVGSLGPLVVVGLPRLRRQGTLHARLVVAVSAILLVVPALLFIATEHDASLAGMGWVDTLSNAWFQSVTLRTAGFNSVDLTQIAPATWTLMILTMFVGGSPGSTAGGAKTTTLGVLLLAVAATVRGRPHAEAFGRRIPHRTVYEATAITTLGVLSAVVALFALQLTQRLPLRTALFEVVSALATVGLSIGGTAQLDGIGKILIILCMFAGRVGPLTLFLFLAGRTQQGRRYPTEPVQVG